MSLQKIYPHILIVGSIIGLWASFILILDTISLIKNPSVVLPCNINPLLSCTSIASTWQSSVFGFPNPLLGIIAFSMLFAIGVMLLSHGRSKKSLWLLVNLGTLISMVFIIWFFYQSVYKIGSLCLYCMIVWTVSWPIFLYTTVWNFREEHFKIMPQNSFFNFISKYHIQILIIGYLIPIILILFHFRDFFFI